MGSTEPIKLIYHFECDQVYEFGWTTKNRPDLVDQISPPGALHCLPAAEAIALRTAPARVNRYDPMK